MKRPLIATALAGLGLLLAACGTNPMDRTVSGAAIGAGTGAAIGAAFGGVGVVPGTVVGAVAGGATGALTDPRSVNLGRPAGR